MLKIVLLGLIDQNKLINVKFNVTFARIMQTKLLVLNYA